MCQISHPIWKNQVSYQLQFISNTSQRIQFPSYEEHVTLVSYLFTCFSLGLRYIFGQFGEISSIYLKNFNPNVSRGSTTWAFVTFDNPLAASTAMEKVNMTNTFGLHVKLAMSEQEKSVKKMTEQEKDMLILEQQRKLEAFQRTQGIGLQDYPVDDILGPIEGKAAMLKVLTIIFKLSYFEILVVLRNSEVLN